MSHLLLIWINLIYFEIYEWKFRNSIVTILTPVNANLVNTENYGLGFNFGSVSLLDFSPSFSYQHLHPSSSSSLSSHFVYIFQGLSRELPASFVSSMWAESLERSKPFISRDDLVCVGGMLPFHLSAGGCVKLSLMSFKTEPNKNSVFWNWTCFHSSIDQEPKSSLCSFPFSSYEFFSS